MMAWSSFPMYSRQTRRIVLGAMTLASNCHGEPGEVVAWKTVASDLAVRKVSRPEWYRWGSPGERVGRT